jgi:hypothetical protein
VIATVATLAPQAVALGEWLMPAGAAIGAATALFIRARRAKRDQTPTRGATAR